MSAFDAIIVGGGIVGASAAYQLTRRGNKVLLLDQYDIPNEWAASGDHARVFRLTYGKDLFYTELAVQALNLWKDFQKECREELYVPTGMLDLAVKEKGYEEQCFQALQGMRLPVEKLGQAELRERYRILNARAIRFAVFHPDGGMLWANRAVTAYANAAMRKGAVIRKKAKVTKILRGKEGIKEIRDQEGKSFKAPLYLFCPGPWAKELLASFKLPLKPTKQELLYFRPPQNQGRYRPEHCPIFASLSKGYYGFPVHIHGFMKVGYHKKGPTGKPGPGPQDVSPKFEKGCRAFLREFMPDASGFVETEGKICYYNNTPDDDFILDRPKDAPNAVIATGLSGHGFKFGPLLGNLAADLLLNGKTDLNIQRFSLARFKR